MQKNGGGCYPALNLPDKNRKTRVNIERPVKRASHSTGWGGQNDVVLQVRSGNHSKFKAGGLARV